MDQDNFRKMAYKKVHEGLLEVFTDELAKYKLGCILCGIGSVLLFIDQACFIDTESINIIQLYTLFSMSFFMGCKRYALIKEIEKETNAVVDEMTSVNGEVMGFIEQMAGAMSQKLNQTVTVDGGAIFDIASVSDSEKEDANIQFSFSFKDDVIEVEGTVVDDRALEIQNRAFALRDYIEQVAYENFEDDLNVVNSVIIELTHCNDEIRLCEYSVVINNLAQKAYEKALNLYGASR